MLYVAYGSNLNVEQMKYRVPGAKPHGSGYINNWKLDFHGTDGTAYATITHSQGYKVPVVLWEMSDKDELIMDMYEGYPNSYYKKKIAVYVGDKKKFGTVYIMNEARRVARPSRKYVNTVRNGYTYFDLDLTYLNDALDRNSVDFYQDDLIEVREFKKFVVQTPKKSGGKKPKKKKGKYSDISIWKEPKKESKKSLPGDLRTYMGSIAAGDGFWDAGYEEDYSLDRVGSKRKPSLDDYDGYYD